MKFISLLTDFGLKDNFVGVMKGVILKINPSVSIVDITHDIEPQNILQAGFLLKHSFRYFPKGTIHLVVVDPGVGTERKAILVKTKNYFFIAPDNGVLSLALQEECIQNIIQITHQRYFLKPVSNTFHGRDIFAPVAGYLSKGLSPKNFGKPIKQLRTLEFPQPKLDKDKLSGQIIYIDRFGNLVSNITKKLFLDFVEKGSFFIKIKNKTINKVSCSYQEVKPKELLAIFGSFDCLEISARNSSANRILQANVGTPIEITRLKNDKTKR